ncbi:hypothetical protein [Ruegeria sp. HKCCD7255]|uniref:hypothetical protein n=1 Tax=Ruegeria sp. HKCCD7255 TaxID=2683004 RepID=UPI0014879571|nr:hypothetical protein [Ruegeria sp. HKCCD7255]
MKSFLITGLFTAVYALPAIADQSSELTVGKGWEICRNYYENRPLENAKDHSDLGFCLGITRGVYVVMRENCNTPGYAGPLAVGTGGTNKSIVHSFYKWADENPDQWSIPFTQGLIIALIQSFPCAPA